MKKNIVKPKKGLLWDVYEKTCHKKALQKDSHQKELLSYLQHLYHELESPRLFSFLFKRSPLKGLYIWGEVGRGKTFLMDLFFNQIHHTSKRRIHFHAFMDEVHSRLHQMSENRQGGISELIKKMSQEAKLLCFDEFQVTNIADAMIMARLFEGLFQAGVVVVATSNTNPDYLYEKGLHRERFLPFISLLQKSMEVFHLQGEVDYRRLKLSEHKSYYTSCDQETLDALHALWNEFTENAPLREINFGKEGPSFVLKGLAKGMAWANFHDLCGRAHGKREYFALAEVIHTLILWGIPKMTIDDHNEAARFTTLIDILYDKGVWLVAAAEAAPELLYQQKGAFDRTVSRLYELQHG